MFQTHTHRVECLVTGFSDDNVCAVTCTVTFSVNVRCAHLGSVRQSRIVAVEGIKVSSSLGRFVMMAMVTPMTMKMLSTTTYEHTAGTLVPQGSEYSHSNCCS